MRISDWSSDVCSSVRAAPGLHLNHVAILHLIGGDVDALAVHGDVAVVHELAGGEDGRHELGAVDHRVEPALQQADEVFAGVAAAARGHGIVTAGTLLAAIGRAWCRESVCQDVWISGDAASLKKKTTQI